jgi:phage-related protein
VKSLKWVGSSKKDLLEFPTEVRREIGYALYAVQKDERHESIKLFKGHGSGIYEIVSDFDKGTYRAIYIVNLGHAVYVLHAFQKKSKKGIKTPKEEIIVIKERLKKLKVMLQDKR